MTNIHGLQVPECKVGGRGKTEAFQKESMIRDSQSFSRGGEGLCWTQVQMSQEDDKANSVPSYKKSNIAD